MIIETKRQSFEVNCDKEPKPSHLELFENLAAAPDNTLPLKSGLLLLCTPRCGSTLFAEALNSTGSLGWCEEWFNYEYFHAYMKVMGSLDGLDLGDYTNFVVKKTIKDTGVFCLKWHIGQIVSMNEDFGVSIESLNFDHIVYLYRRDKIAQAVSFAKAVISNQFRSYESAEKNPEITRANISDALNNIVKFDLFARRYFGKYIDAYYAYEEFRFLNACPAYNDVLAVYGKPACRDLKVDRLKRQANKHSHDAIEDFRGYVLGDKS